MMNFSKTMVVSYYALSNETILLLVQSYYSRITITLHKLYFDTYHKTNPRTNLWILW